ncbi:MAG: tetratricopeptide repeat protein [Magnetococcales bacterium]|nr:tetratricopeptide repeat protein [Magnetococcales bacterium]
MDARSNHSLLYTGWVVLLTGLAGIFLPLTFAHLSHKPDHPLLFPMIVSAIGVTTLGGSLALGILFRRHRSPPPTPVPETEEPATGDRCDAVFQWKKESDPGDEAGLQAIVNMQNPAIRSLAAKLYQKPGKTFRLNNILRSQAENYRRQMNGCGIDCRFEPPGIPRATEHDPLERFMTRFPDLPAHLPVTAAIASLVAILWPLLVPSWHAAPPNGTPRPSATTALLSRHLPRPFSSLPAARNTEQVERQRLIAELALIDFPFKELGQRRDRVIEALTRNDLQMAREFLEATVTDLREEQKLLPFKDDHLRTITADLLGSLGDIHLLQSRPAAAAQSFADAAETASSAEQHVQFLQRRGSAQNLAGDTLAAEQSLLQSLHAAREKIGPKHPLVISSLSGLGRHYESTGQLEQAEPVLREALALQGEIQGPATLKTAETIDLLAQVMSQKNQSHEALVLLEQSLRIKESLLGTSDPGLIDTLAPITEILLGEGRVAEAEATHERILEIEKQTPTATQNAQPSVPDAAETKPQERLATPQSTQSPENPTATPSPPVPSIIPSPPVPESRTTTPADITPPPAGDTSAIDGKATESNLNGLASRYYSQGDYDKALELFQRSLELSTQSLGENNPTVAASMNNLASILASLGRYDEALPLFEKSLKIKQETLPQNHLSLATSMKNIAAILSRRNRYGEAEQLQKKTLEIHQEVLGMDHPEVAASLNNLARTLDQEGRFDEALPLYRRSLDILTGAPLANQAQIRVVTQNYANLLRRMNRTTEAMEVESIGQTAPSP